MGAVLGRAGVVLVGVIVGVIEKTAVLVRVAVEVTVLDLATATI